MALQAHKTSKNPYKSTYRSKCLGSIQFLWLLHDLIEYLKEQDVYPTSRDRLYLAIDNLQVSNLR